jgi:hypothetical protein
MAANVLRRIFGPTKGRDGTWRIKTNDELDEIMRHKNIINHIKEKMIKLVWPFTLNVGRENGEKSIHMETDVNTTTGEAKEQMGR